ncbi:MAG: tetratricopeptide repeat protein [Chitinophagales bacterium]
MRTGFLLSVLAIFFLLLTFCTKKSRNKIDESPYLNQNDTVQYVGMETCRLCHIDKHSTFIHTGMGKSFDHATREKSAGIYDAHAIVFDSINNFYYKPFWENDSLKILEFRIEKNDTVHKRIESIAYIIGSGQHTNSHLINVNGYIYQAPITFYTQKKHWDLAPGMESGFNSRFSRVIETECMNCHNGLPELVAGSVNKYESVPVGIDCERCHGPGSLHVARVSNNILVDTAKDIDYSIVNPKKLSVDLQNELCMRCHLQGVNVLNEGATFFDFKPGDKISDHWNIFLPAFDGKNDKFLMASQADRLMQSKCFIESKKLSCITCHDPHLSVKETPVAKFNQPCMQCHTPDHDFCTADENARMVNNNNCSGCHIPKSGSIDIPHVSISDHKIQIPQTEIKGVGAGTFRGLKCITTKHPDALTMAKGYLHYYESFNNDAILLDSAIFYLNKVSNKDDIFRKALIHYYYLKQDFNNIIQTTAKFTTEKNIDVWAAYRIGESYLSTQNYDKAAIYFEKAVKLEPYNLDYNFKLGTALVLSGKVAEAEKVFLFITKENPEYHKAWNNLGVIQMNTGKLDEAEQSLLRSIALDPDYYLSRIELAHLYINTRQKTNAKAVVDYLNAHIPDDEQVILINQKLRSI